MRYRLLLCLFVCVSCTNQAGPSTTLEAFVPAGEEGEINITSRGDHVRVDVSDESGIGGGTIKLLEGQWPETIAVRLHLKGLESLNISNGKTEFERSQLQVMAYEANGDPWPGKYLLNVKGFYEVKLPVSLLSPDTDTLEIRWVDFYR